MKVGRFENDAHGHDGLDPGRRLGDTRGTKVDEGQVSVE